MADLTEITKPKEDTNNKKEEKDKHWWEKEINILGVSSKQILFFTKNLSVMLQAGSTLTESLEVLVGQTKGKLKNIVRQVHKEVSRGHEFSEALKKYPKVFSDTYISILQVGEKTGSLGKNLQYLVDQLEKTHSLKKKIFSAMLYPAIVLLGGVAVSIGIIVFVLPKVTDLFESFDVALPWSTQLLMAISSLFQNYGLIAGVVLAVTLIVFYWVTRQDFAKPVTHWVLLEVPVVKKISKHFNLAMFFRTLSILLKSGVTIDEGIKICKKSVTNVYYKDFLDEAYEEIKGGSTLTDAMRKREDLFPATNVQIINVGEDSGTLGKALKYCSDIHEEELDDITKNLSDILEPVLLIAIGLMVGFLAVSIITPIYSITGDLQ
ncbi:MAG: type II secretion system F family protein [Candidatus Magasanikbacteria bacterium]